MSAKLDDLDRPQRTHGERGGPSRMQYRVAHGCATAALGLVLALAQGCTSSGSLGREYLDRRTGATIATAAATLVFARTDARYSRSGRDYLYVGPVLVNQQGFREYYIWVGLGTTLDRGYLAPERPMPSKLQIIVDDELMEFGLRPWETIGATASAAAYQTSVAVDTALGARITLDQIERLSSAAIESVFVSHGAGQHVYSHWAPGEWSEFLRHEGETHAE